MPEWIKLDTQELNLPRQEEIDGVVVTVRLSPHDIPIAVRGGKDPLNNRFIIEFKYLDEEPYRTADIGNGLIARIGRRSERLYGVELPVTASDNSVALCLEVPKAIESLDQNIQNSNVRENHHIAGNVFKQAAARLFSGTNTTCVP